MGWTYSHKDSNESVFDYLKERFASDKGHKLLDLAVVNMREAYGAYQLPNGDVVAIICLLGYDHNDYKFNFGYKDMDETMEPYYYNCPKRIMDMLTPVDQMKTELSEYGRENTINWRTKCLAQLNKPIPKNGDIVKFEKPLNFVGGYIGDTFKIEKIKNRTIFWAHGCRFHIRNWKTLPYSIQTQY